VTLIERWQGRFARRRKLPADQRDFWEENGYLVLRGFFSEDEVEVVNEYVEGLWAHRRELTEPIVLDYLLETDRAGRSLLRDSPDDVRDWPYKLNDLYLSSDVVRGLAISPSLCEVLQELLDGEPMAINTLNFERGSQQADHFDTFFMPAPVKNRMLATWVALEDIEPSTGPLQYYPRSNHVAPFRFSHGELWAVPEEFPSARQYIRQQVASSKLSATTFTPRKGDVFIWHSQLLHGGSPIDDLTKTRKSLVTHYFRLEDFDPSSRRQLPAEHVRRQFGAMGPAWRDAFLYPRIRRTGRGQAYLDKWAVAEAARNSDSA
jgi:ectoine hydroxylase-related dioxygenase (phytanoyl-CoA dioxygenase family)